MKLGDISREIKVGKLRKNGHITLYECRKFLRIKKNKGQFLRIKKNKVLTTFRMCPSQSSTVKIKRKRIIQFICNNQKTSERVSVVDREKKLQMR